MNKEHANVRTITESFLCTACGACAGICPVHAVTMEWNAAGFLTAKVDPAVCVNCRKCLQICPSNGERSDSELVGTVTGGYVGYAEDPLLRKESQSGGIVTALLLYLLENDLIDGAVVTAFDAGSRRAKSFLAQTRQDILSAKGSCYCQTSPVELILKNQDKRLAAVLLGCQAESLAQIRAKYPKVKLPVYTIGLICGGNLSGLMVDDLLEQGGVCPKDTLRGFRFRDKTRGWPGDVTMETDKSIMLPKEKRMELKPFYQNYRCLLCTDKMNLSCDLVVGDPWGISMPDEALGYSAVLSRTERGESLLTDAQSCGYIRLMEQEPERIVSGQQIRTDLAMRHTAARKICAEQGWRFPYHSANQQSDAGSEAYCAKLLDKIQYTRALQSCSTAVDAKRLVRKQKRKHSNQLKEMLYQIKKKLLG